MVSHPSSQTFEIIVNVIRGHGSKIMGLIKSVLVTFFCELQMLHYVI